MLYEDKDETSHWWIPGYDDITHLHLDHSDCDMAENKLKVMSLNENIWRSNFHQIVSNDT